MVSDISAGSTRLHQNADPVGFLNTLLDRGVNYIDASPDKGPPICHNLLGEGDDPRTLEQAFRKTYNLRIPVTPVAAGELPRFELKSRRWIKRSTSTP